MRQKRLTSGFFVSVGVVGGFTSVAAAAAQAQTGGTTGTPPASAASSPATVKAKHEIESVLRLQCAAMERKDVDGADRPYTNDYHIEDTPGGPVGKAERDKSTGELLGAAETLHVRTTVEDLHLSADGKTATLIEKTHLILTTHPSKTEKSHTLVLDGAAREVWVKAGSAKPTWLKQSKKSLSMTESVDGAPYTPPPAAAPQPAAPTAPGTSTGSSNP